MASICNKAYTCTLTNASNVVINFCHQIRGAVEASVSDSTQIADLTLEIEILVEL